MENSTNIDVEDIKSAAKELWENMNLLLEENAVKADPVLKAHIKELAGLFQGQFLGRISSGSSRIADLLQETVARFPSNQVPDVLLDDISFAASFGLTTDAQKFTRIPPIRGPRSIS